MHKDLIEIFSHRVSLKVLCLVSIKTNQFKPQKQFNLLILLEAYAINYNRFLLLSM